MKTLLIVDLQKGFHPEPRLVQAIERVLPRYDQLIFTRFIKQDDSLFARRLQMKKAYKSESPESELCLPRPANSLVFDKPSYGLSEKHLEILKKLKIKEVDICGVDTDACVLAICFNLWDAHILPKVLPKLCASNGNLHREALKIIRHNFKNPL